jgi:hypothetical protein
LFRRSHNASDISSIGPVEQSVRPPAETTEAVSDASETGSYRISRIAFPAALRYRSQCDLCIASLLRAIGLAL